MRPAKLTFHSTLVIVEQYNNSSNLPLSISICVNLSACDIGDNSPDSQHSGKFNIQDKKQDIVKRVKTLTVPLFTQMYK